MKNPYRSLLERPLRALILTTLTVLFVVKLLPGFVAFTDRSLSETQSVFLASAEFALALTCLLDLATAYYVTAGWCDLLDRPWVIFLTPAANLAAAIVAVILYGGGALMAEALREAWWTLLGPIVVMALLLILQIIAAIVLYQRLRKNLSADFTL